ncbi:MAG: hypothetical protein KQH83_11785 [Actinobacteria bacterium]|nr:hypothetical protein [Actinomycetota bacterium]
MSRSVRFGVAGAVAAVVVGLVAPAASAAPPINAQLEFTGRIDSVARQGNECRYTATLHANVASTAGGTPEGFTAILRARWAAPCEPGQTGALVSGTADARLTGVASTAGGTPEGFRFNGTATNVASTAGGTPDGFRFRGTATG